MSETRRRALKILGSIGAGCAFPFPSDELHGQHVLLVHDQAAADGPYTPSFSHHRVRGMARLTDVIIPDGATRALPAPACRNTSTGW